MRVRLLRAVAALGLAALPITAGLVPASAAPSPGDSVSVAGPDAPEGTAPAALRATPEAPVRVAVVVPLVTPGSVEGLIPPERLEELTSPAGSLSLQLAAVTGTSATLAIDPRIIASIRVLGSAAPESATAWLRRLDALPNESFALAYADADVVAAIQAGTPVVPAPVSFDFAVDPGRFSQEESTPAPVPGSTESVDPVPAEGESPVLPATVEDVLAWDHEYESLAWPAADTVRAADLPVLAEAGYESVLLDSDNTDSAGPVLELDPGLRGLVSDSSLSSLARDLASADTVTRAAGARAALTAGIAATPEQTTVIAFGRADLQPVTFRLSEAISTIETDPAVQTVDLGTVLSTAPTAGSVVDTPESPERSQLVSAMLLAESEDSDFLTIAEDPLVVTGQRRLQLLALLSTSWLEPRTGWETAVQGFLDESAAIRTSVQIQQSTDLLASGEQARVPVTVTNALDVPVTVYVTGTPLRPILTIDPGAQPVEITVQPDSSTTGYIPAQAVANGQVLVRLSLNGASGVPVGESRVVQLDLQAGWETAGIVVISVGLVLVFGVGITRNILKRRRAKAAGPDGDADADAGAPTTSGGVGG